MIVSGNSKIMHCGILINMPHSFNLYICGLYIVHLLPEVTQMMPLAKKSIIMHEIEITATSYA